MYKIILKRRLCIIDCELQESSVYSFVFNQAMNSKSKVRMLSL